MKMDHLVSTIPSHHAVNNDFYNYWMTQELSPSELKIFFINYWAWTHDFPQAVSYLIFNLDCRRSQSELVKTFLSEMGYGKANRIHFVLFEEFCKNLSSKMNQQNKLTIDYLRHTVPLLAETKKLIAWEKKTYHDNARQGAGAQLALEWQAYTMLRQLYEGTRHYRHYWTDADAFHEACEFFYVHLGAAEKDHKIESFAVAKSVIKTSDDFDQVKIGFDTHLRLIAEFWDAIASQIIVSNDQHHHVTA